MTMELAGSIQPDLMINLMATINVITTLTRLIAGLTVDIVAMAVMRQQRVP